MELMRRGIRDFDFILVAILLALIAFSCLGISGVHNGQMPSHAWVKQLAYGIVGLIAMFAVAFFDYRILRKYHWWLYGITTLLLIVVFKFPEVNYAHSWIRIGGQQFQPSEFAKIALVLTTASLMANEDEKEEPDKRIWKTWPIWLTLLVPFALTLKEPALGQALVLLFITGGMFLVYTKRWLFMILTLAVITGGVLLVTVPVVFPNEAAWFVQSVLIKHNILHGFQGERIMTWLDHSYQLADAGYNVHQAQVAIGSGQVFGEGLQNGLLSMNAGVPNEWTDYIFSSIGEQFGFVGSSLLILCFLGLSHRLIRIVRSTPDPFGIYAIVGMVSMFAFQVFENIGMDMYMSPSTGITLPFISYGGSSIVANFICIGIALSVAMRFKPLRFSS